MFKIDFIAWHIYGGLTVYLISTIIVIALLFGKILIIYLTDLELSSNICIGNILKTKGYGINIDYYYF